MTLNNKIRAFITENLIVFEEEIHFSDDDNIFECGFVSSLFAMKLLTYVENEFQINIDNEDMDIANFSSVNRIVNFVETKTQTSDVPQ